MREESWKLKAQSSKKVIPMNFHLPVSSIYYRDDGPCHGRRWAKEPWGRNERPRHLAHWSGPVVCDVAKVDQASCRAGCRSKATGAWPNSCTWSGGAGWRWTAGIIAGIRSCSRFKTIAGQQTALSQAVAWFRSQMERVKELTDHIKAAAEMGDVVQIKAIAEELKAESDAMAPLH